MNVEIKIVYNQATGDLQVQGPLPQKGLCYLMLEMAKDVVREFGEKQKSAIVPASQIALVSRS